MPWAINKRNAHRVEPGLLIAFEQAITLPIDVVARRGNGSIQTCAVIYIGVTKLAALNEEELSSQDRAELILELASRLQLKPE